MTQNERGGSKELEITPEQMEEIRKRIQVIVQEKLLQQVIDMNKPKASPPPPVDDRYGRIYPSDLEFGKKLQDEWKSRWATTTTGRPQVITSYQEIGKVGSPSKTREVKPKRPALWRRLAHRLAGKKNA